MLQSFLSLVSNNALASTLVGAAILGTIAWAWRAYGNWRDGEAIYDYLVKSQTATGYTFRSTAAIASDTRLPEERVAVLCAKHPRIRRNAKEKQSWTLAD
jgi:hypothetical protein